MDLSDRSVQVQLEQVLEVDQERIRVYEGPKYLEHWEALELDDDVSEDVLDLLDHPPNLSLQALAEILEVLECPQKSTWTAPKAPGSILEVGFP